MAQGIQDYYDTIQRKGFQRRNLFRIAAINGDGILSKLAAELTSLDGGISNAYLTTATVPGRSIQNVTAGFMGMDFNVPGNAKYDNSNSWTVQFRLPGDLSIRNAFEQMSYDIFDDGTSTGCYGVPNSRNIITLALLNIKGEAVRYYDLIGVYPVSFGGLSFDLTGNADVMTFNATLAYQYFRINKSKVPGAQVITDFDRTTGLVPALGAGNAC